MFASNDKILLLFAGFARRKNGSELRFRLRPKQTSRFGTCGRYASQVQNQLRNFNCRPSGRYVLFLLSEFKFDRSMFVVQSTMLQGPFQNPALSNQVAFA